MKIINRLAGIVIYFPNNYMALCKRSNNEWEMYNDLSIGKISFDPRKTVTLHAAIYIKIS